MCYMRLPRSIVRKPRLVMLIGFTCASVINYSFSLVMGWLLIPDDFGLLAFAQTLLLIGGLILTSGISWSLAAAIATAESSRREPLVRGALIVNLMLATAIGAGLTVLFVLGPLHAGLETGRITALVVFSLPFISLIAIVQATAQGMERFPAVAGIQVSEILCKAIAGVIFVRMGFGAAGAIAGFLVGAIFGTMVGFVILKRHLKFRFVGSIERISWGVAGPMFGSLIGIGILLNLDILMLKLFQGDDRALTGYYQAGIVLANAPYYLVASALTPVLFTQLARVKTVTAASGPIAEALKLIALLIIPIEGMLMAAPSTALALFFPHAYAPGAPALRMLAIGNAILIVVVTLSTAFQAVGLAKIPARFLLGVTAIESVALRLIVPHARAIGAATIFAVASLAVLLGLAASYLTRIETQARRRTFIWLTRYCVALAAGGLGWIAVQTATGDTVFTIGAGSICYAGAVWVLLRPHYRFLALSKGSSL